MYQVLLTILLILIIETAKNDNGNIIKVKISEYIAVWTHFMVYLFLVVNFLLLKIYL